MTRYFYDTEFVDDGVTIDLISIGIVCEDGRELYMQSCEFDASKARAVYGSLELCKSKDRRAGHASIRRLKNISLNDSVHRSSDWVTENVLPHLVPCPYVTFSAGTPLVDGELYTHREGQCTFSEPMEYLGQLPRVGVYADCPWRRRDQIKHELMHFMNVDTYGEPELWGYCSAYDHVAFCQLFGTMMDLPKGYPMYTKDIKQWVDMLGYPNLPKHLFRLLVSHQLPEVDALGNSKLPEQGRDEHNALSDARWNKLAWEFLAKREDKQP